MFHLSKIFSTKLKSRLMGIKFPYSISFINCELDWYKNSVLEKGVKKNRKTVDLVANIPAQYEQVKSDVILLTFVNPTNVEVMESILRIQDSGFLNSDEAKDTLLYPMLNLYGIKGGSYQISNVEDMQVGESKINSIKITGEERDALRATLLSETVLIPTATAILIFDLIIMDKDEPKIDLVRNDFRQILDSLKI